MASLAERIRTCGYGFDSWGTSVRSGGVLAWDARDRRVALFTTL